MRGLAARRSACLGLLFVAVYGWCNWITAQRTGVATWFFEWERLIPFWPLMIVPYLSIDAFFLAAPFHCRDRTELRVLSQRITAAIAVAGLCFVAYPLRFGFERPAVDGLLGVLFQGVATLDRPHNLFPSLHVTLAVILAETYARHSRGLVRMALIAWFALIGVSTVLTFQHHAIDLIGGLFLAAVVFYGIRENEGSRYAAARNVRVAIYYALGSGILALLGFMLRPWGVLLAWPALSLAIVSGAYLGAGPWVFAKANGRMGIAARILLWPYLLGQRASLAHYRRLCRPYDVVVPGIWLGRRLDYDEAASAVAAGVTAVVDLTADFDEPSPFTRVAYKNLQTLDLMAPSGDALAAAVRFLDDQSQRGVVYVHCKIGYSRSAAVVGAWLLASGRVRTAEEALGIVRGARPQAIVRREAIEAIRRFGEALAGSPPRVAGRPTVGRGLVSAIFATAARLICGAPRFDSVPSPRPRVYFANHTSHLDFVAIWGSLPPAVRANTQPVAGSDYWQRNPVTRFVARHVLRAVLVERRGGKSDRTATIAGARRSVERAVEALDAGASLIVFPEGTRGTGAEVAPFKSGLYHLCHARPDVELVPVFLQNFHRILPKGEVVPLPIGGSVAFGRPIRLRAGEGKAEFLARARADLLTVNQPCPFQSTAILRAS